VLAAGDRMPLGDAMVTVLAPGAAEARDPRARRRAPGGGAAGEPAAARNDGSLVLRLDWRGVAVLLTGDLTRAAERELVAAGAPVRAAVLKVAHHGSRSSTAPELVAAVRPRVALVSAGRRNPFGHPAPEVVARLEGAGARVYRTDRDGAILLATDGATLEVTAWATGRTERLRLDAGGEDTATPGIRAPGAAGGTREGGSAGASRPGCARTAGAAAPAPPGQDACRGKAPSLPGWS
jgi:competence protein ComEC